jgi:hypothetical protein
MLGIINALGSVIVYHCRNNLIKDEKNNTHTICASFR